MLNELCSILDALVMKMLNELYSIFDALVEKHNVYKSKKVRVNERYTISDFLEKQDVYKVENIGDA
ncbi:hypothetical protein T484DRAFT_1800625 [Baffinella frigidus]|nr:hypothetical protein T484DRAFT_1800625 [Cryptophyta sp. CCMP2293]